MGGRGGRATRKLARAAAGVPGRGGCCVLRLERRDRGRCRGTGVVTFLRGRGSPITRFHENRHTKSSTGQGPTRVTTGLGTLCASVRTASATQRGAAEERPAAARVAAPQRPERSPQTARGTTAGAARDSGTTRRERAWRHSQSICTLADHVRDCSSRDVGHAGGWR